MHRAAGLKFKSDWFVVGEKGNREGSPGGEPATRAKKASLPNLLYVYCTKILSL
jgi:hypothetical protein